MNIYRAHIEHLLKSSHGVLRGFQLGGSAPRRGGSAPLPTPMEGLGTGAVDFLGIIH